MRAALSKLYQELDKVSVVNGEVLAVTMESNRILGDGQHEIPVMSWPELLPEKYQGRNDEILLDFRRAGCQKKWVVVTCGGGGLPRGDGVHRDAQFRHKPRRIMNL